jgi:decaprenylphospho-beta-D-ribofuranose 2-oxidase
MKKFLKIISFLILAFSCIHNFNLFAALFINDVSRLNQTQIYKIVQPKTVKDIQDAVLLAKNLNKKVAVAGMRHSQGGHISYHDAVVLDMLQFNNIVHLDVENKIITVQAGITWKQIQEYCNTYNLAVKSMQSFNEFTVGGSMSVNVHGQDVSDPLIGSIIGFRMVTASGTIIEANRHTNSELFKLAIGGYGLFGIITDVDIELTDNVVYKREIKKVLMQGYVNFFQESVKDNKSAELHFARFNIDQNFPKSFLNQIMAVTYYKQDDSIELHPDLLPLQPENNIWFYKNALNVMRRFNWTKTFKFPVEYWGLKKSSSLISRNNTMYNGIQFLDYTNESDTDVLQEYFIPVEHFQEFTEFLRKLCLEKKMNLLNVTIRYVPVNVESVLSFSQNFQQRYIPIYL